jgi:F-type H+-transporting ATPase subunit b
VKSLSSFWKWILPVAVITLSLATSPRLIAQEATPAAVQAGSESTPAAQSPEKNKQEEDENDAYRHSATVKALGAKLGLDAEQAATAFTVGNFVVLALLVGWFLLKALPKTFRTRSESIQKHLTDARRATEEASTRLGGVEARLAKLDEQIAAMKAQAEKDAASEEQRIKASVEEEKQKILAAAEQEIGVATEQARRQIQRYAAELAIEQAARKLVITPETDRLLVQSFASRLATDGSKGGRN